MKNSPLIRTLLSAAILAAVANFCHAAEAKRPNILVILADDLGWSDVGCYGQKGWQTPNIDRIARDGVRFTSAYAAGPLCSPTRSSILTGKYPHRIGMTFLAGADSRKYKVPENAVVLPAESRQQMPPGETTVAAALRAGGYATCIVGKWHVGGHPKDHGFDAWPGFTAHNNQERFVDGEFFTEVQAAAAIEWLRKKREAPFFLIFSTHAVHMPLAATQAYIAESLKQGLPATGSWNATYAAYMRHLDDAVGRLLDENDSQKRTRETVVFFVSDNGGRGVNVSRNDPLRGAKGQLYEGGIRVPLLVRWPSVVRPGSVNGAPVISTDFYPTFLEMAGLPLRPDQHCDGASLLSLLKGAPKIERDTLFWHHPHYSTIAVPHSALRSGDWKLIQYYSSYRRDWDEGKGTAVERQVPARIELFNLAHDLSEREDLAVKQPSRAEALQRELNDHLTALSARMPTQNPSHNPAKPETGIFAP